jgi:hypothetical protein
MGYQKSLFAKHLLENKHTLYPIEKNLSILHHKKKGRMLSALEQYYIYIGKQKQATN